ELDAAIEARTDALADVVVDPLQREWERGLPPVVPRGLDLGADGLIAHYELDGNFSDISGRFQHGRMITGDPTFDAGRIGRAVSFDGDTEVSFGDVGRFDRTDRFSIAFWVKPRGNQPIHVVQKLKDAQGRRGYEWQFDDILLVGIQRWAGRLMVTLASDTPAGAIQLRTRDRFRFGDWHHVALTYDGSGKAAGARPYVNGDPAAGGGIGDARAGPIAGDAPRTVGRRSRGPPFLGQIDDMRVYDRVLQPGQIANLAIHYPARVIISGVFGKRTKEEAAEVRDYFLTHAAPETLRTAYAELKALNKEKEEFEKGIPTAMVMADMKKPRDTFVLARGDYRNPTEKVQPGVPAMLPPLPKDAPLNRLTLARWLVDPNHPLTARVAVNRFWQMYFGYGIVKTQEDFGVQGEPPVHPELLDWLAAEFVRTGWDTGAMQRRIVTSATYRQSSSVTAALRERDPENRLLARASRFRFPAETIRDTALAASGLLNRQIGGPSVLPYQPKGLWGGKAVGAGHPRQGDRQSSGKPP